MRTAGPQSQKGAGVPGPSVLITCMGAPQPLLLLQNAGNWIPCLRFGPAMSIVLGRIRWPSGTVSKRILGFGGNSLLRPSWCASTGVPHVPVVFLGPSFRLPWSFGLDLEAWRAAPGGLGTL